MAKDFQKKQPTKNEQMIYEMFMRIQSMDQTLYSNSLHLLALGKSLDIAPEKMAELLTQKIGELKEYGEKINKAIEEIRAKDESNKEPAAESPAPEAV